jgi:hypothetical protein
VKAGLTACDIVSECLELSLHLSICGGPRLSVCGLQGNHACLVAALSPVLRRISAWTAFRRCCKQDGWY